MLVNCARNLLQNRTDKLRTKVSEQPSFNIRKKVKNSSFLCCRLKLIEHAQGTQYPVSVSRPVSRSPTDYFRNLQSSTTHPSSSTIRHSIIEDNKVPLIWLIMITKLRVMKMSNSWIIFFQLSNSIAESPVSEIERCLKSIDSQKY